MTPEQQEKKRRARARDRQKAREHVREYLEQRECRKCGFKGHWALTFHHLGDEQKSADVSRLISIGASISKIDAEIAKCEVLCANCHLELHYFENRGEVV